MNRLSPFVFALPLSLAVFGPLATAQVPGVSREQMWWAPTAADWKKPVLIEFQRSWADAVKVSKETGKPILICVNMDGEIASEHYAGVRYRMPEIAKLYKPYVCVIASVYRHNPRDYDEKGNRVLCPRFGSVTCAEHIWIEPGLFQKYFDGQRVAPRHIMVELDGKESYDVYYAFDTDSVFGAIKKGIAERRKDLTRQIRQRAERKLVERVASRDIKDRDAVEAAYRKGSKGDKQALLEAAMANIKAEPLDLLRLAIFDLDTELNRLARQALMQSNSEYAIDLINEALRVPMPAAERDALIAALDRLGKTWPRAKMLANVHRGLARGSDSVDVQGWSKALATAKKTAPVEWTAIEARIDYKVAATKARPKDATPHLELAEASLQLAIDPKTARILAQARKGRGTVKFHQLMFQDAQRAALKAEQLGASGWRPNSILAICAYYTGKPKEAHRRAEAAVKNLPKGDASWNAMAVLGIFAEGRMAQIYKATNEKKDWPKQWLTDVHSTYAVLAKHPLGTGEHVVVHYDFLKSLAAKGQAAQVLEAGLKRFPDSGSLHDRLRGRILAEKGVNGLEATYEALLKEKDASKHLDWFAGYASIVAAEFHRRAGDKDKAIPAYQRAVGHFDRAIQKNPETKGSCDHFAALAIAGRARIAFEDEDYDIALNKLFECFARKPSAAGSLDGLTQTPMDTARLLRAKLAELKRPDLVAKINAEIAKLPPSALELPEYERNTGRRRGGRGNRGGRGGNRRRGNRQGGGRRRGNQQGGNQQGGNQQGGGQQGGGRR